MASRVRHGGFLCAPQLFDNTAFGVSPAETAAMDPQQRLLLEHGYAALHDGQLGREALSGSLTGIFLGIPSNEFGLVLGELPAGGSVYSATGSALSIAAGRLSYALGLHGPCVSYETACSSALTACHGGLFALLLGQCTSGLVAGVNMMFGPTIGCSFAVAGMTSALGRCHTFDHRADGYARGEALGAAAIRPHDEASWAVALLSGSSVRQDGRRVTLTAPNGLAQQMLVQDAVARAGTDPASMVCIEAAANGSLMGDPIEARSVAVALAQSSARSASCPLVLHNLKGNGGHSEPASGAAGMCKLALELSRSRAAPIVHLRLYSELVSSALAGVACALPTQLSPMDGRWGGVSSFGFSGTIGHVVGAAAGNVEPARPAHGSTLRFRRRSFPLPRPARHSGASASRGDSGAGVAPIVLPAALDTDHVTSLVLETMRGLGSASSELGADVPFGEAGIDSFALSELARQLRERTGHNVTTSMLAEHPTPSAIAASVLVLSSPSNEPVEGVGVSPTPDTRTILDSPSRSTPGSPLSAPGSPSGSPGTSGAASAKSAPELRVLSLKHVVWLLLAAVAALMVGVAMWLPGEEDL